MAKFLNKGGSHGLADGTIVKPGGHFHSDDPDIQKKFPNKFEKVSHAPVVDDTPPTPAAEAPTATDGITDVTADFPLAAEHKLAVTKDKAGYWVMDDGDAVNEKALRTKPAVVKAITDYVKD